jgi:hypothetical protein
VHDDSTRALQNRRRRRQQYITALAALLLAVPALPTLGASQTDTTATIGATAREAAHEVRIGFTKAGREGIELAARLVENGGLIQLPISWTVTDAAGGRVYDGKTPTADFLAPPGDYEITVRYGTVTVKRALTLLPEQRIGVVFTLDIGGIRVLPRVEGIGLPAIKARSAIFATSGPDAGRQIALSTVPGEVIRVSAGTYHIETRFTPGNTVVSDKVTVKPGIMSAVELDHKAGIARLSFGAAKTGETLWIVTDAQGEALPPIPGNSAEVVLEPGDYTAEVTSGGATARAKFTVAAGETSSVTPAP